ncbi:putative disease resistance RPP13-like protein 1 [Vitis vinifera]|uniref:Putative disease resistance RPP13-like protein 1 n=1 Tax=Vitis vinifera TaxID=29760 RepID=A0A438CU23_VITVI|nr:putative disease resistance RPP13-like protein 1 [Vitis vinifera]
MPVGMGNLINLRHLDIAGTSQLEEMPPRMGSLTNLQTLSKFMVGKGNGSSIQELKHLLDLQGELSIQGLHNVRNTRDAMDACLKNKCHIEELTMGWSGDFDDSRNELNEMLVLELLQPQRNLKKLTVEFYGGPKVPSWIGNPSFSKMESLTLKNCGKCTSLPCLGRLSLLKALRIQGMCKVKTIGDEFFGEVSLFQPFPCLKSLRFEDMPEWEDWCFSDMVEECEGLFSCLRELRIRECPKLTGSLPNCLPSLAELEIFECPKLKAALPRLAYINLSKEGFTQLLAALQKLCHGLVSLEEQRLPCNLKHLKIENCANLQRLPNGLQRLTCLEELSLQSCPKLESFPEMGLPPMLRSLVLQKCNTLKLLPHNYNSGFLEYLEIEHCPCLISFPEGELPASLKQLKIKDCANLQTLPEGMMHHNSMVSNNSCCLEVLEIRKCSSLPSLPTGELPSTLKRLEIWDCRQFQPISEKMLHSNTALEHLSISNYPNMKILPGLLHSLTYLYIYGCQGLVSFPERGLPTPNLRDLYINNCENLKSLPHQMQNLLSLQELNIRNCQGLESFPECGLAPNLTSLSIRDCVNLKVPLSEWASTGSLLFHHCTFPVSRKPFNDSLVVCIVFFPPSTRKKRMMKVVSAYQDLFSEGPVAFSSAFTQQFD